MPLTFSVELPEPGDDIDATALATLFTDVKNKFGQITGLDIAADAQIPGSTLAVNSLPGDRLEDLAVATGKIGNGAVTNQKVADLTLQKGKLSTTSGQKIARAQVELLEQNVPFGDTVAGSEKTAQATPTTPIPTATYDIVAIYINGAMTLVAGQYFRLHLTTSGPNYVAQVVGNGPNGSFSGFVKFIYIAKT